MKLTDTTPSDLRLRYQAVRLDHMRALPGNIYVADEETGDVVMIDAKDNETKTSYSLGPGGLRLVEMHVRRL